ncbi:MAG: hypothetical protein Q4G39_07240 [Brachymonas sp.]|nr:hypothetical protein [Brachymonas sp.]
MKINPVAVVISLHLYVQGQDADVVGFGPMGKPARGSADNYGSCHGKPEFGWWQFSDPCGRTATQNQVGANCMILVEKQTGADILVKDE